uniref:t-SNARE domain-containing protein 1-like n=1 Tax=Myxine glutinosa TaxID=7769 RepID=UPI00358FFBFA
MASLDNGEGEQRRSSGRRRKSRFKGHENAVLIKEVLSNQLALFGPRKASANTRRAIWQDIATKINALGGCRRQATDIQKRWHDIRGGVKKKAGLARRPGRLGAQWSILTPMEERILATFDLRTQLGNGQLPAWTMEQQASDESVIDDRDMQHHQLQSQRWSSAVNMEEEGDDDEEDDDAQDTDDSVEEDEDEDGNSLGQWRTSSRQPQADDCSLLTQTLQYVLIAQEKNNTILQRLEQAVGRVADVLQSLVEVTRRPTARLRMADKATMPEPAGWEGMPMPTRSVRRGTRGRRGRC